MTARRALPYAAAALVDEALMTLSNARRQLLPLLEKGDIEVVARAGRALDQVNQAIGYLKEAKIQEGNPG
jgi:hypothetical protein